MYSALEDKYAFGYFQSRPVQRHLKKLLKVPIWWNSGQNAKQMPPSTENRKIITTLSQKILPPVEEKRRSKTIETEKDEEIFLEREKRREHQ